MAGPALEVRDLSKRFRIVREKPTSIKQRVLTSRTRTEDLWALHDVSLDVHEGSTFGLIGHNGSGKTTLLKCVAGILRPTSGTVRQLGRLAALLELGAGFHPELTGREVEVLGLVARGLSNADIGRELYIGEATVKTHLIRAFAKLGVTDRTAAVTAAYASGLIELPRH